MPRDRLPSFFAPPVKVKRSRLLVWLRPKNRRKESISQLFDNISLKSKPPRFRSKSLPNLPL